jgi:hypothetical protein
VYSESKELPRFTETERFDFSVAPGTIVPYRMDKNQKKRVYRTVSGISDERLWRLILLETGRQSVDPNKCLNIRVWSDEDPAYLQNKEFLGEDLRTFPVETVLYLFSSRSGRRLEHRFNTVGTAIQYTDQDCLETVKRLSDQFIKTPRE